MTPPREPNEPDPPAAYVNGDPDAVRAAAPREPSEEEWESTRRAIHARLNHPQVVSSRRQMVALAGVAAALVAVAGAVVWLAFGRSTAPKTPQPPEMAKAQPAPVTPVAPAPHEPAPDPLAAFAVLPMASDDDVVLHRVPGDGWLPVGEHPLPGLLSLATSADVELDDPDATWPNVSPAPGYAPMIFAAKPR
jgi:hypothetical protein